MCETSKYEIFLDKTQIMGKNTARMKLPLCANNLNAKDLENVVFVVLIF